jgi:hypothetical protein
MGVRFLVLDELANVDVLVTLDLVPLQVVNLDQLIEHRIDIHIVGRKDFHLEFSRPVFQAPFPISPARQDAGKQSSLKR